MNLHRIHRLNRWFLVFGFWFPSQFIAASHIGFWFLVFGF